MLGLPPFGVHFTRVRAAVQRLAAIKIHAQFVSGDKIQTRHQSQTFRVFDDVTFQEESFGDEIGEGNHRLTLSGWYLDAINRDAVVAVDLGILQSVHNPHASRLYELLLTKFTELISQKKTGGRYATPRFSSLSRSTR